MQTIYHIALVFHIAGLTMMAGTTLVDYIAFQQFWKYWAIEKQKGYAIIDVLSKFPVLIGVGIVLLIISGVTMMGITHGVFGEQLWFRIKFALVILIIINGLAIGRRQGVKLRKALAQEAAGEDVDVEISKAKRRLNRFHFSQIILFIIVFSLSVFKFN